MRVDRDCGVHRGRAEEKQSGRGNGDSCACGMHVDVYETDVTELGIQGCAATGAPLGMERVKRVQASKRRVPKDLRHRLHESINHKYQ